MKILAIVGSLKSKSLNKQLAIQAKELFNKEIDFEILEYSDLPFFNEELEANPPDSVKRVREKVEEADGLWIFTPEYNHSYPALLKNIIDWLSRPIPNRKDLILARKPVAISGIALGIAGTSIAQDLLVSLLSFLNLNIMNSPRLTIPSAFTILDENREIDKSKTQSKLEKQGRAFIEFIEKTKNI